MKKLLLPMKMVLLSLLLSQLGCSAFSKWINGNPSPSPTQSPTPSPVASISVSPTATPKPKPGGSAQLPDDQIDCVPPTTFPSQYGQAVEDAERAYVADPNNKSKFKPGTECLLTDYWDSYYFDIVDRLNKLGTVDAIVDNCGGSGICGEIVVKAKGVKMGTGFSEGYAILISSGCVRHNYGGSFKGRCTPAWFEK